MGFRVVVGSDDAGYQYKQAIVEDLNQDPRVAEVIDIGVHEGTLHEHSYPHIGLAAAQKVAAGEADRAVLVCGTGIGMAISANKVPGIRATVAHDSYSVERSILSNDCQVLALGQRVIGLHLARRLVKEWLGYAFDASTPSGAKVAVITDFEHSC
ncbi:ribose-5-phosphate isomerase [Microbispora siamensis]|uniref:ribose-5-phosphate isomerase n=1 Tax=Microbispora siamensis TaxID=564413 RepID=UPI0019501D16|nr:ribose-5-phosphate isomerase [Microbispora siamensis]